MEDGRGLDQVEIDGLQARLGDTLTTYRQQYEEMVFLTAKRDDNDSTIEDNCLMHNAEPCTRIACLREKRRQLDSSVQTLTDNIARLELEMREKWLRSRCEGQLSR